jgi:PAS domain S-box-containing protein
MDQNDAANTYGTYLSYLFEYCPYAILLTAPDGDVFAANPAACDLFKTTEAEICRLGRAGLVDQTDPRLQSALIERELTGKFSGEIRFIHVNGEVFEGEIASNIFYDELHRKRTSMVIRDISIEKELRNQLITNDEKYHTLADFTYDWESWISPDKDVLYCSPSCERITDRPPDYFYRSYENYMDIVVPEDQADVISHTNIEIPGDPEEIEFRIIRPDGSIRWIAHACQAVFDHDGNYLGRRISNRDITDRKASENILKLSEKKYRSLFENSIVGISQSTHDGQLINVNQAYAELYGYSSPEEMLDQIHDIGQQLYANPLDREKILNDLSATGFFTPREVQVIKQNGDPAIFLVAGRKVMDSSGKFLYYQAEQIDISEYKKIEKQMVETRGIAQSTIDSISDQICVTDQDGMVKFGNKAWFDRFGRGEQSATNKTSSLSIFTVLARISSMSKVDINLLQRGLEQLKTKEAKKIDFEFVVDRNVSDGSTYHTAISPLISADSQLYIFIFQDISEQRKIYKERENLYLQVASSNDKLKKLSERLLNAHENERRSVARELHDVIGQELTAIKMDLQNIERDLRSGKNQAKTSEKVNNSISAVENAIEEVRELSIGLHSSILDNLGIVPAIRWLLVKTTDPAKLKVSFITDLDEVRFLPSIEIACYRIFQEALNNVLKHAQASQIRVAVSLEEDILHLTVGDNGKGYLETGTISPAKSVDSLGLISMQERARLVGGSCEIHSIPGKGTQVEARFPITQIVEPVVEKINQ